MPESLGTSNGKTRVEREWLSVKRMGARVGGREHPSAREQSGSQKARHMVCQSLNGLLLIVVKQSNIRECEEKVFDSIPKSVVEEFAESKFVEARQESVVIELSDVRRACALLLNTFELIFGCLRFIGFT
jgi:hypothetical protein